VVGVVVVVGSSVVLALVDDAVVLDDADVALPELGFVLPGEESSSSAGLDDAEVSSSVLASGSTPP
jgi:hypothetical protein